MLLELQSTPERFMAVRLLAYLTLFYQRLLRDKELTSSRRLPPVLPVVLYNGKRPWVAPREVSELIEPVEGGLGDFVPRFRYLVLDEGHLPAEALEPLADPVTAVFRIEQSQSLEEIRQVIDALGRMMLGEEAEEIKRDFAAWLRRVVLPARLEGESLPEVEDLKEMENMIAERVKSWPKQWMAEGLEEGLRRGRQEGRREGQCQLLRNLLERRFGALSVEDSECLARASVDQLALWAERVLTASSLDEVFHD